MEHGCRKFTCSGPAVFLFKELESKQGGVNLLVSLPSTPFTQLLCVYSTEIKRLAENSLVRMSEDVLVLTLQLLSLSCFQIFIYTAPCHFKRDFRIRASRLTLIGQGQKLVNIVFRDVSQGQALSKWDKSSQKTEAGKRKGKRQEMLSHTWWTAWISDFGMSPSVSVKFYYQHSSNSREHVGVCVWGGGVGEQVDSLRLCAQNCSWVLEGPASTPLCSFLIVWAFNMNKHP